MPNDTLPMLGVSHTRKFTRKTRELFATRLPELYSDRMSGASFAELATRFGYGNGEAMTPGEFEVLYIEALYAGYEKCAAHVIEMCSKIPENIQAQQLQGVDISEWSMSVLTSALGEISGQPASRALADHLVEVSRGTVWYCKTDIYPFALLRKYQDRTRRRELVSITDGLGIHVICELDAAGKAIPKKPVSEKQGVAVPPC
jgi:hypothetical protein